MTRVRKPIGSEHAFSQFLALIEDCSNSPVDHQLIGELSAARLAYERRYLALFAIILALKFSHEEDWRLNGQDLFTAISARLLPQQASRDGVGIAVEERTLADRLAMYNLVIDGLSRGSPTNMLQEVGRTFAMLFDSGHAAQLEAVGTRTFSDVFDRVLDITTTYRL